jgi:hypothetical protein
MRVEKKDLHEKNTRKKIKVKEFVQQIQELVKIITRPKKLYLQTKDVIVAVSDVVERTSVVEMSSLTTTKLKMRDVVVVIDVVVEYGVV